MRKGRAVAQQLCALPRTNFPRAKPAIGSGVPADLESDQHEAVIQAKDRIDRALLSRTLYAELGGQNSASLVLRIPLPGLSFFGPSVGALEKQRARMEKPRPRSTGLLRFHGGTSDGGEAATDK